MRAVLHAFQDEGFVIKNAVPDLGLLTATKELDLSPDSHWSRGFIGAFAETEPRWPKTRITEANATVSPFGVSTRVRITFQEKVIDNLGGTIGVREIDDPAPYREIFGKIDQSIFIQKQKI